MKFLFSTGCLYELPIEDSTLTVEVLPHTLPNTKALLVEMSHFQLSYLKFHTGRG